jgi:hypothetical protein
VRFVFVSAWALAVACSSANGEVPAHAERREPESEPAAEPEAAEEDRRPEIDPSTACGRALECCRVYCAGVGNVPEESACEGVYEAIDGEDPDGHCRRMAVGWGEALRHLRGESPTECQ